MATKRATVTYIVDHINKKVLMGDQQRIIVGTKGYGGKIKDGRTWQQTCVDETGEETGCVKELRINPDEEGGIVLREQDLIPLMVVSFYENEDTEPAFIVMCTTCHIWEGKAVDTKEMVNHTWYSYDPYEKLPYSQMIAGDDLLIIPLLESTPMKGYIRKQVENLPNGDKKFIRVIKYHLEPCRPEDLVI